MHMSVLFFCSVLLDTCTTSEHRKRNHDRPIDVLIMTEEADDSLEHSKSIIMLQYQKTILKNTREVNGHFKESSTKDTRYNIFEPKIGPEIPQFPSYRKYVKLKRPVLCKNTFFF